MDDKLRELGTPLVRVAPVPDQELGEVAELVDGEIGGERGLTSLLADDADTWERGVSRIKSSEKRHHTQLHVHEQGGTARTDIGGLNHRNIVTSVSDAAHSLLGMSADQAGDVGFLRRRTTARDDGRELGRKLDEILAEVFDAELPGATLSHV